MKGMIYDYLDYRIFIREWYEQRKRENRRFSFRTFSEKAGFKSRSYIQNVIKGDSPLSKGAIPKISKAMGLDKEEEEFLTHLVLFKHAKSDSEKNIFLNEIRLKANKTPYSQIGQQKFEYFSNWYIPVIRELICYVDFEGNYLKLARMLSPEITSKQAHDAVDLLLDLGLVKEESGVYYQVDKNIFAHDDVDYLALRNYQKNNIKMGSEALERFYPQDRNILSVTGSTTYEGFKKLNKYIDEFHKKVVEVFDQETGCDKVYQINVQMFPFTRYVKGDKDDS